MKTIFLGFSKNNDSNRKRKKKKKRQLQSFSLHANPKQPYNNHKFVIVLWFLLLFLLFPIYSPQSLPGVCSEH